MKKQERFCQIRRASFLSARTYIDTTSATCSIYVTTQRNGACTADESTSPSNSTPKSAIGRQKRYYTTTPHDRIHALVLETLTDTENPQERRPGFATMRSIEKDFESLDQLRERIPETADAMFGMGSCG